MVVLGKTVYLEGSSIGTYILLLALISTRICIPSSCASLSYPPDNNNDKSSLEQPVVMASRKSDTDADVELATASLRKLMPDVATHWRSISGKKGAALVNQAGYDSSAIVCSISVISERVK